MHLTTEQIDEGLRLLAAYDNGHADKISVGAFWDLSDWSMEHLKTMLTGYRDLLEASEQPTVSAEQFARELIARLDCELVGLRHGGAVEQLVSYGLERAKKYASGIAARHGITLAETRKGGE